VGRPIAHLAHNLARLDLVADLRQVLETREPTEHDVRTSDGGPLLMRIHPYRAASSDLDGVVLTFVDVTELKEVEQALREANQFLDSAIENMPSMVKVKDAKDLRVLRLNRAGEELFGMPRERMIGKSLHDLLPAPIANEIMEQERRVIESREPIEKEHTIYSKERAPQVIRTRNVPILDDAGEVQYVLGISDDITQRESTLRALERSEARFRSIFESAPVSIWELDYSECMSDIRALQLGGVVDIEHYLLSHRDKLQEVAQKIRVVDVNPATVRAYEASDKEEIRHSVGRALLPETIEIGAKLLGTLARGEREGTFDCAVQTFKKRRMDIRFTMAAPPLEPDFSDVLLCVQDVTAFREYERRIEETMRDLQNSNEELEQFAYVASHDLQEPLRKLISFSQLLREDVGEGLPAAAERDLEFIIQATTRMKKLIHALLEFGRAGRGELACKEVDLTVCANHARGTVSSSIQTTGATVRQDDLPRVTGDESLLTVVFQNLVSNALKFTVRGRAPQVHITFEELDGERIIGVRDNGIGIDAKYFEEVFAPFKKLHGRGEYAGSGIGLAICRRIVERHRGRIWVESSVGHGAHFRFTLGDLPLEVGNHPELALSLPSHSATLSWPPRESA
jgi:PAS domain S-box-containing protein